jgi:rhodanese-related sulfurtransferase
MKRYFSLPLLAMLICLLCLPSVNFAQQADTTAMPQIKTMTTDEMVAEAKKFAPQITPETAKQQIDNGSYIILDVREPNEFKQGHIPAAINIPRGLLEFKIAESVPNKDANIITYCKVGGRGALAAMTLKILGYKNVENIAGGWEAWLKAGYEAE